MLWRSKQDLRSRLQRAFNLILLGVALLGVAGVGSRLVGLNAVDELVYETQPLLDSNARLLQILTDAQSAQRGYRLTRDEEFLARFVGALEGLPEISAELRELSQGRPQIRRLLLAQTEAADAWLNDFSLPLLERIRADPSFRPDDALTVRGTALFDEVREANRRARDAISARRDEVEADVRQTTINAGVVSAVVLSWGSSPVRSCPDGPPPSWRDLWRT